MSALLDRLYNLHWVTPGVARSAQPYMGFYKTFLRAHQFKSMVNLRGENASHRWWRTEQRVTKALGIRHFDVRLSSRNIPSRAVLLSLFEAFAAMETPAIIECLGGQDRTGLASALYVLSRQGPQGLQAAEGHFALWPYLHWPKAFQRWLQLFPAYVAEQAGATPLKDWARERYDPLHFVAWLNARGAGGTYTAVMGDEIGV